MSCSDIIESLDSLWFFSNVVSSSRTEQSAHAVNDHDDAVLKEEAPPKPMNQIEEEKQNESPCEECLVPKCPKCVDFGKEEVEVLAKPADENRKGSSSSSSSSSRRRSRRRRRSKRRLRKNFGELDHLHMGFDYGNYMDFGLFDYEDIITTRQHKQVLGSGSEYHHHMNRLKMPPLDDNIAMKEHLKLWAYAVACTVR